MTNALRKAAPCHNTPRPEKPQLGAKGRRRGSDLGSPGNRAGGTEHGGFGRCDPHLGPAGKIGSLRLPKRIADPHAVEVDGWVFVTGQMPTHPNDDDAPLPAGIEAQTRRVMDNLILVLNGAGLALEHVVSARVFLTRFEQDYAPMNEAYRSYFPPNRLPARTCVGVTALARGALVEIDFIARRS